MAFDIRLAASELRRRKVYRAAAVYVAVGLAVLGAAELILDPLGLAGLRPSIVVLVILGFPIALVLAWTYEVRPEAPSAPREADARDSDAPDPASTRPRSIAVLPFDSMSPDPGGDYFADGVAEELTNTLARQEGLRVVARTSAFAFRGERVDVREIGRRLDVTHVIEGSVRRTDRALRITAQLISTRDGYHVWSEQFDRMHGDVFRIQEEIASCVLERLLHDVGQRIGPSVATAELSAYDAYLKGRHAMAYIRPDTLREAITHFETAIRRDDRFAPALAALAEALTLQSIGFAERPGRETMPRAAKLANRALELDPRLPEAHLAHALSRMYLDWDFAAAKEGIDRALELNPNFAEAHFWDEFYWTYVEHDFQEAVAANRRAHELSPLDSRTRDHYATIHYIFGKLDRAEELLRQALAEGPDHPLSHLSMADTLLRMGRMDEALAHAEEAVRLGGRAVAFLGILGYLYGILERRAAAEAVLSELEDRQRAGYAPGFWVAVAYAGSGRMDDAFACLDRAVQERDGNLLYLFVAPRCLGLHDDPRFPPILKRIGLGHLRRLS
jgi:TolB-like protein/Tfp pilus assembly protein PilF